VEQVLREEISLFLHESMVQKVPIFNGCDESFLSDIVVHLRPQVNMPDEVIIDIGGVGDRMFFLSSGSIEILIASGRSVRMLQSGDYMGEFALITGEKRSAAVIVRCFFESFEIIKTATSMEQSVEFTPVFVSFNRNLTGSLDGQAVARSFVLLHVCQIRRMCTRACIHVFLLKLASATVYVYHDGCMYDHSICEVVVLFERRLLIWIAGAVEGWLWKNYDGVAGVWDKDGW
jgi:hypothetical protein